MHMFIDLFLVFFYWSRKFRRMPFKLNEFYEFRSLPESRNSFIACDDIA